MIGYIILIVLLLLSRKIKNERIQLIFMFAVIAVFSGLRYGIGYDYYSYLNCCLKGSYRGDRFELIPQELVELSKNTFPYLFFIITSCFICFFYYKGIKCAGSDYYYETFYYLCFPLLFYDQLGIIRQGMASAVLFYAISLKKEDKFEQSILIKQVLLIILAFLCHRSALMGIFILLPLNRIPRIALLLILISSFFVGNLLAPLVQSIAAQNIVDASDVAKALEALQEENIRSETVRQYLIYIIAMMALLVYDKIIKINRMNSYYIAIVVIGASMYALFAANPSLAKRACLLYFSASIYIVPHMFKLYRYTHAFYLTFFLLLFSYQIYLGSNNRRPEDTRKTSVSYPYRTFIEKL